MRSRIALLTLLLCCSNPAFAQEDPPDSARELVAELLDPSTKDAAFSQGIAQLGRFRTIFTDPGMLSELKRLYRKMSNGYKGYELIHVASAICQMGSLEDCRQVFEAAAQLPDDDYRASRIFNAYSKAWIREEVRRLAARQRPLAQDIATELDLPDRLVGAAPELQEAWWVYKAAQRELDAVLKPFSTEDLRRSFQFESDVFWRAVKDFMLGHRPSVIEELGPFQWASTCGTESGFFRLSKFGTILVELLMAGNYRAALGTLPYVAQTKDLQADSSGFSWPGALAELGGTDWERLMVGYSLDSGFYHTLDPLTRNGSSQTGHFLALVLQIDAWRHYSEVESLIDAAATFVTPGLAAAEEAISKPRRQPESKASTKVQLEILDALSKLVDPQGVPQTVNRATLALRSLGRPETKQALWRAYGLPLPTARQAAFLALAELGEQPPPLQPLRPVPLRYLLDGRPLGDSHVRFVYEDSGAPQYLKLTVGDDGVADLPLASLSPIRDRSKKAFSRSAGQLKKLDDLWFEVSHPLPEDRLAGSRIEIQTAPLIIELEAGGLRPFLRKGLINVELDFLTEAPPYSGAPRSARFLTISESLSVDMNQPIIFSRLGLGVYQVSLAFQGAVSWQSGPIELTREGLRIEALLEPGAHVNLQVEPPGDQRTRDSMILYKLQAPPGSSASRGPTIAFTALEFSGLPLGAYSLRIYSSSEKAAWLRESGNKSMWINQNPRSPPYQGHVIEFEINGHEPVLDLGIIRLAGSGGPSQR